MRTASERLAAFAGSLSLDAMPSAVREAAKLHFLDALGAGLAAHALGLATEGRSILDDIGGRGSATVIGQAGPAQPAAAAFANAMLCHGLDYDDTHGPSICHVSTVVGPVALAAGEASRRSGAEVLVAIVAGNEIVTRLGMAAGGGFHARGFHPTAVCGIFGATAAAARLGGLDLGTTVSALGIAGSLASGILAFLADGSPTKPIHAGWASHGALVSARLAVAGALGPRSVLEGRFGLFHAFAGREDIDLEDALNDLGTRWETPRIAFKPYPACHLMHGALGAISTAVGGRRLSPGQIAEVVVQVPRAVIPIVLEPAEEKARPRTPYDAKFSLPFSAAALLASGRLDIQSYGPAPLADPTLLALARRVRYEAHEFPAGASTFAGRARLRLADGQTLEAECLHQKGAPENPLSSNEVRQKFRANATMALSPAAAGDLEAAVLAMERASDLRSICGPLSRA
jgi:2-methylcitrate dehydratase PrpD